jgi:hypothetical protein
MSDSIFSAVEYAGGSSTRPFSRGETAGASPEDEGEAVGLLGMQPMKRLLCIEDVLDWRGGSAGLHC